jgi:tetratricopeptide (TPR) repeat protein
MRKKIVFTATFVLSVVFLTTAASAAADASDQLKQADTLTEAGQYQQAEAIYQQIIIDYAGTDHAFEAQKGLTILYVATRRQSEADAALQELLAGFCEHERMAPALRQVADAYRKSKKYRKGLELHQHVVDNFAGSEFAMRSQRSVAALNLYLGNETAAETATEKLFSEHQPDAEALYYLGRDYSRLRKHKKASELYQYVVENFPGEKYAVLAETGLAISNIALGNEEVAEAATEKLLTDFSGRPGAAEGVRRIADEYRKLKRYEKALELHQRVVDKFAGSELGMRSQRSVAALNLYLGDETAAQTATEKLLYEFKPDAEAVYYLARDYSTLAKYEGASQLYQYVIGRWSSDVEINSRKSVVMSYICLGLDAEAQSAIENLTNDFKDHPDLCLVLWQASEAYYDLAFRYENEGLIKRAEEYFNNVISIGVQFMEKLPHSPHTAEAYHVLAICHERLDEYPKAIEYYQKVVDNWPDFEYAWSAQFLIGHNYKRLSAAGVVPASEAYGQIRAAFEQVIQKYPDCPAADAARGWLESSIDSIEFIEGEQK